MPQTLLAAVAALPFSGGLTPLATPALIKTISFIASGGLVPGRLLQRLDALVEKTHRQAPHLHLFGPLLEDQNAGLFYREHEKLGKLATGALKSSDESLADKVARVRRYITLVERLMCLVPRVSHTDVLAAVRKEVRAQIEQSYLDALAAASAHPPPSPSPSPISKRTSQYSSSTQHSKRSRHSLPAHASTPLSATPPSPTSSIPSSPFSRSSNTFPAHNLGTVVEGILKSKFPLDVRGVATVVRLVLVAWTLSVGSVKWEEGEEGVELWRGEEMKGVQKMLLA